jgi:hypothetical protein
MRTPKNVNIQSNEWRTAIHLRHRELKPNKPYQIGYYTKYNFISVYVNG